MKHVFMPHSFSVLITPCEYKTHFIYSVGYWVVSQLTAVINATMNIHKQVHKHLLFLLLGTFLGMKFLAPVAHSMYEFFNNGQVFFPIVDHINLHSH